MTWKPTIRRANWEDFLARDKLMQLSWESAYGHIFTPEEIQGVFDGRLSQTATWIANRRRSSFWLAEQHEKLIGFVGIALLLEEGHGEVTHLFIHPDHQGQGIGQLLWDFGLARLRERDCTLVWVWALEKARAVDFYHKQECKILKKSTYIVGDDHEHIETVLGFRLELNDGGA